LVPLVQVGCLYAALSLWAELEFLHGLQGSATPQEAAIRLRNVATYFPVSPRFLRAVANFYIDVAWPGSNPIAIEEIRKGIELDPLAGDLHRALAGYLYSQGDQAGAQNEAAIAAKIARQSGVQVRVYNPPGH